jgi:hypothetical protein
MALIEEAQCIDNREYTVDSPAGASTALGEPTPTGLTIGVCFAAVDTSVVARGGEES